MGDAYLVEGRAEAALAEYAKGDPSERLAGRAMVYHALGRKDASQAALLELLTTFGDQAGLIATVHAYRGEKDLAFASLDRAYEQRDPDLVYLKPTYLLTPLHGDPRWGALLVKMGLPLT